MPFLTKQKIKYGPAPKIRLLTSLLAVSLFHVALAQEIPAPVDQLYPGTIQLDVDATNLNQKIFKVHERIPVSAGKLTLLYPQWLPGNHSPAGPLTQLAGLLISANGQPIEWTRDTVHMYAFHLSVPADVSFIDVDFQFLSPVETNQGRITVTSEIVGVQWNTVVLYPAGYFARDITFKPSVTLPADWKFGTASSLTATSAIFGFYRFFKKNSGSRSASRQTIFFLVR